MLCVSRRAGGQGRARRQHIRGGTADRLAPSAQPGSGLGDWKPALGPGRQTPGARQGCLLRTRPAPPTPTPGLGLRGREGPQPDVQGPGLCAGSGGRGRPGASKRRKGGSGQHLHCASPAPRWPAWDPRRAFRASAAGAGPLAVRQVVTGQRGLELHVHSFIYASINY